MLGVGFIVITPKKFSREWVARETASGEGAGSGTQRAGASGKRGDEMHQSLHSFQIFFLEKLFP